jgi:ParB family chromosome partitioning protein
MKAAKQISTGVEISNLRGLFDSGKPHVLHNSGENEWYTPPDIIERARRAMGAIDCDPASCALANKTVTAEMFYTAADNGLSKKWRGRVWLNPPYSNPLCSQFCEATMAKFLEGEINQACILVNNATETAWFQKTLRAAAAVCFLKGRVNYLDKTGEPANTPLQGQAVLYFGKRIADFQAHFSDIGIILVQPGYERGSP